MPAASRFPAFRRHLGFLAVAIATTTSAAPSLPPSPPPLCLRTWSLLGPIPLATLDGALGRNPLPAAGDESGFADDGFAPPPPLSWRPHAAPADIVDLLAFFGPREQAVAYARTAVWAPRALSTTLRALSSISSVRQRSGSGLPTAIKIAPP